MKKILAVLFLVTASVSLYSLPLMMGFQYGVGEYWFNYSSSNRIYGTDTIKYSIDQNFPQESLGIFFDIHYARLTVSYTYANVYAINYTISNEVRLASGNPVMNYFRFTFLDITLLGKLPIQLNPDFNIWFGAGIEYSINLTYDWNGNGTNDLAYGTSMTLDGRNMNDFIGVLAIGFTLNLSDTFALTPIFTAKYDFNHFWKTDEYLLDPTGGNVPSTELAAYKNEFNYNVWKFDLALGLAIRL